MNLNVSICNGNVGGQLYASPDLAVFGSSGALSGECRGSSRGFMSATTKLNPLTMFFFLFIMTLAGTITFGPTSSLAAPGSATAMLERQPAAPIWYWTRFPPIGTINGKLKKIENIGNNVAIYLLKKGKSSNDCPNPDAVIPLGINSSTQPSDLVAIYGSEEPPLPVPLTACSSPQPGGGAPIRIFVRVYYEYVPTTPSPQGEASVSCSDTRPGVTTCRIDKPNVKSPSTTYSQVVINGGDQVSVDAGGCVQTGGLRRTWKRYVDPKGPNSDRLYFGSVSFSSLPGSARLSKILNHIITVPGDVPTPTYLELHYMDDDYGDNGYWGHDDGTGDQCKNVGPAWVVVTIQHGAATEPEWNINRPGSDFMRIRPPYASSARCKSECERKTRCVAYSYLPGGRCYLKQAVPRPQLAPGYELSVKGF